MRPGGAKNYMADGKMTEGFAFVAYPAEYRSSGVMTFIVNQDGVVYQKDLGRKTDVLAKSMKEYNPEFQLAKVGRATGGGCWRAENQVRTVVSCIGCSHAQNWNGHCANNPVAVDSQIVAIRVAFDNQQIRLRLLRGLA